MAIPIPVIIKLNRSERPSNLKSKFTPKEGTHAICCKSTFPLAMYGINEAKNINRIGGRIKSNGLHFAFKYLPKNTIEIENSSPDNTANSIKYYLEICESSKNSKKSAFFALKTVLNTKFDMFFLI